MPLSMILRANRQRGASLLGYGLVVGLISVVALSTISTTGSSVRGLFGEVADQMGTVTGQAGPEATSTPEPTPEIVRASCNAIAQNDSPSSGFQLRTIDPGGTEIPALCYFDDGTWGGGGFTAIAAQYETDPIQWDEGRQADYQPDLINSPGTSFALTGSEIPGHSSLLFGRIGNSSERDFVDLVNTTYSTGNIALVTLTSPVTSNDYQLHRDDNLYYFNHNPEGGSGNLSRWNNTLLLDQTGGIQYTWAFSPQNTSTNQDSRGFAYDGAGLQTTSETFAWVLWVR